MKRKLLLFLAFFLLSGTPRALAEQDSSLSLNLYDGLEGQPNLRYERRLGDFWGAGVGAVSAKSTGASLDWNVLLWHFYGRAYPQGQKDGFFVGAGLVGVQAEYAGASLGTASSGGITAEGGYQWRWQHFNHELGYEFWKVSDLNAGSNPLRLDFLTELVYRVGWYF